MTLLCLLGLLQGLLLTVAIATYKDARPRSRALLLSILLGSCLALGAILYSHLVPTTLPINPGELLEYLLWPAAGPTLLLYITVITLGDRWPSRWFAFHFLPALLWLIHAGARLTAGQSPAFPSVELLMAHQAVYTVVSVLLWSQFRRHSADRQEGQEKGGLGPGPHQVWASAVLGVVALSHGAQWTRWLFRDEPALRSIVPLVGAMSFVAVAVTGLRRAMPALNPSVSPAVRPALNTALNTAKPPTYASSTLSSERAEEIAERLLELMNHSKVYLTPDLTLDQVAKTLGTSQTHLSQVLNAQLQTPFLDLLARYRVQESVRLLSETSTRTLKIEAIARRSGFRSRSAFYEAFKKFEGTTPAQYRKRTLATEG